MLLNFVVLRGRPGASLEVRVIFFFPTSWTAKIPFFSRNSQNLYGVFYDPLKIIEIPCSKKWKSPTSKKRGRRTSSTFFCFLVDLRSKLCWNKTTAKRWWILAVHDKFREKYFCSPQIVQLPATRQNFNILFCFV